jgi:transposase-like protein
VRLERIERLRTLFLAGLPAAHTAKQTGSHPATVHKYYAQFRRELAAESDAAYQRSGSQVSDYDEYLYLPATLDPHQDIAKVKHFLTLAYDGQVYNLMMPSFEQIGFDPTDRDEQKLLYKYLRFNTVSQLSTQRTTIQNFWEYFERFIARYKGVSDAQFVYYLKEAEWRFNMFEV